MKTDNYPKNKEIQEQKTTILELKTTNNWGAVNLTRDDLNFMLQEKEKWLNNQC